ncbi:MAG: hypothetical protein JRG95_05005 [Deltaproteobacteria bacterium]|nr:hypothetical protein [Deltaproteobacteria bacterium]
MSGLHLRSFRWLVPLGLCGLPLAAGLAGLLMLGPALLDVQTPVADAQVGIEGVEVFVRFDVVRARAATFRALLNGADVTDELEVAQNGVHGSLHGLLHGDNELRLEIYGEGYWPPGLLLEETRTYHIRFRPRLDFNRG